MQARTQSEFELEFNREDFREYLLNHSTTSFATNNLRRCPVACYIRHRLKPASRDDFVRVGHRRVVIGSLGYKQSEWMSAFIARFDSGSDEMPDARFGIEALDMLTQIPTTT